MSMSLTPEPSPPPPIHSRPITAPSSPANLQPTRCGRIRRAVTKFGSMIDSDTISDPEDGAGAADDDEDEAGYSDTGESSGDDFAMGGDESDEGPRKKRKSNGKKVASKPPKAKATVKVTATTKKAVQPKISTAMKAVLPASGPKTSKGKLDVKVKPAPVVLGKTAKAAKRKLVDEEEEEERGDAEAPREEAQNIQTTGADEDHEPAAPKPSAPPSVAASTSSKPSAKKAKKGISLAPSSKAPTTTTTSKKSLVPLKKTGTVELKPAAPKAEKLSDNAGRKETAGHPADAADGVADEDNSKDAKIAKKKDNAKSTKATGKVAEYPLESATQEQMPDISHAGSQDLVHNEEDDVKEPAASGSSAISTPRKLAPAEKLTTVHRLAIVEALFKPEVLKQVDYASISARYKHEPNSSKLSRHCREVLSPDVRDYVRDGSMPKSKKLDSQGAITMEQRVDLWQAVGKMYEKADWKGIEQTTGMSTTKLKRHFRDVMQKDVAKAINAK